MGSYTSPVGKKKEEADAPAPPEFSPTFEDLSTIISVGSPQTYLT